MFQYRQNGNNKLENIGKLIVVVGAILGTIALVLVLTRKCKESYGDDCSCGVVPCIGSGSHPCPQIEGKAGTCVCNGYTCGCPGKSKESFDDSVVLHRSSLESGEEMAADLGWQG